MWTYYEQEMKHFPIINNYENMWPIREMLKLHLKYTSESVHCERTRAVAKKLEKIVQGGKDHEMSIESKD